MRIDQDLLLYCTNDRVIPWMEGTKGIYHPDLA